MAGRQGLGPRITGNVAPVSEDNGWFFEMLRPEPCHVPLRRPAIEVDEGKAWLMLAVPVVVPLEWAVLGAMRVAVPGWLVLLEALALLVLLARADASALARKGVRAPSTWAALVPPLYLSMRARGARSGVRPFLGSLAVATGLLGAAAVGETLAPVPVRSDAVEDLLYQRVFDWDIALDPGTAVVSCPSFDRAWVGQPVACRGWDAQRSLTLEVTPLDRAGRVSWQVAPD